MRVEAFFAREVELADAGGFVSSVVSPLVSAHCALVMTELLLRDKKRPEGRQEIKNDDDDRYRQLPGVARYLARTRWPLLRPRALAVADKLRYRLGEWCPVLSWPGLSYRSAR